VTLPLHKEEENAPPKSCAQKKPRKEKNQKTAGGEETRQVTNQVREGKKDAGLSKNEREMRRGEGTRKDGVETAGRR